MPRAPRRAACLDGDTAQAVARDSSVTSVVTREVNLAALEDLVRLRVELAKLIGPVGRDNTAEKPDTARGLRSLEQVIIEKPRFFYCTLTPRLTCADPGGAREVVTTAIAATSRPWSRAATALNSDSREWLEVAGRKFSSTSPASYIQGRT